MLRYIEISNIALIDRASIEFGPGLCVLTGETGAGKSIVIDSINAALGAKTSKDLVRAGSSGAVVTAVFDIHESYMKSQLLTLLEENGLADRLSDAGGTGITAVRNAELGGDTSVTADTADMGGDMRAEEIELILSREINSSGRGICRVNGKLVSSHAMRSIGELIVDLHGQYENHSLMKREKHIDMIDNYCGSDFLAKRSEYSELFSRFWRIRRQIEDFKRNESERMREIDVLRYQINEIKAARPQVKEDETLAEQIETLSNHEKISGALEQAYISLRGDESGAGDAPSALGAVNGALGQISSISQYSRDFLEIGERISEAGFLLEDIISALRSKIDTLDQDPGRLDKLSERLELIERLKRKYGGSIKEIYKFYRQASERLSALENSAQTVGGLEAELRRLSEELRARAADLSGRRRDAAKEVGEGIVRELSALEMKNCRFCASINSAENLEDYNNKGRDQVEFLFSANVGEELRPLVRIASGGEMSRVMLAIKSVMAGADNIPTMIFDEIDAGISGKAAARVAEKLHLLSVGRQIICVTHLAQIASMADDQYMIEKTFSESETQTLIHRLDHESRICEVARILGGGAPSEASMRLSNELLGKAADFKKSARSGPAPI